MLYVHLPFVACLHILYHFPVVNNVAVDTYVGLVMIIILVLVHAVSILVMVDAYDLQYMVRVHGVWFMDYGLMVLLFNGVWV